MSRFTKLVLSFSAIIVAVCTFFVISAASTGATTPIAHSPFAVSTRVVIRPGVRVGTLLSAPIRGPKDQKIKHYQWERCNANGAHCVKIKGATHRTYRVTYKDLGYRIRAALVVAGTQGGVTIVTTATPVIVGPLPVNTAAPTISGVAQVGNVLTGSLGTWNPAAVSYGYQWFDCPGGDAGGTPTITTVGSVSTLVGCAAISGALGTFTSTGGTPTYTIQISDEQQSLALLIIAYNYAGGAA